MRQYPGIKLIRNREGGERNEESFLVCDGADFFGISGTGHTGGENSLNNQTGEPTLMAKKKDKKDKKKKKKSQAEYYLA